MPTRLPELTEATAKRLGAYRVALSRYRPQFTPTFEGQQNGGWMRNQLAASLPGVQVIILDNLYRMASIASWQGVVNDSWVDEKVYLAEFFDCDDSALYFKAHAAALYGLNSVGAVIDYSARPPHAYNLIVLPDGAVWLLEPQNDNLVEAGGRGAWGDMYILTNGVILI